ncbi:MAG: acyl-CoA dehydrogenase [gamma proteobacterium symbiont of Bathyaustriella thionipta]|nr:acyl-CoA dehydrogenase [gamma proteobacterium symbiont of Bathyaustriella thionipta]
MSILTVFLALVMVWSLAYLRVKASLWFAAVAALLLFASVSDAFYSWFIVLLWMTYAAVVLMLGITEIRQRYISTPLYRQFKKVLPRMSSTEQEALNAGTVWWDAELFSGLPQWDKLLAMNPPALSEQEQAFIDGPTQQLCEMLNDWQVTDKDGDLPAEAWDFIRRQRFFGMIIPPEYGGLGFSALAHSSVVMKISTRCITAAVTVMVPNSLGPAELLMHYGTEAQKNHYLPKLASGEEIPCFALTAPRAGSDAGAIPDTGIICHGEWQGEQVLGIRLNFDKRYITLAPIASVIGLAFKLYDPEHRLSNEADRGITVALIPRDTRGMQIGERHVPLNIPFQNGPVRGQDVFIPLDFIIGGESGIGHGWRMLVECLAEGRGISLPALSTGAGKATSRYTGAYARIRKQFGLPIGYFEGVEEALARIAGLTYQMDAARQLTLNALDCGEKPSVISAIIKYHLTEGYRQVINDAMDIQGGSGICMGPNNLLARAYQALPIAITVEGANILTRSMIIFGQGAIRCHPYVLEEFQAANEDDFRHGLRQFDRAIFGHAGFLISNMARSLFLGLSRARLSNTPVSGASKRYYQLVNWMSAAFALSADVVMMTLGGALKRKEHLSARLGDILSELYLMSAVLKRFEDQGRPQADLPLLQWGCETSLYKIQESFRSLDRNLPYPWLGWILRFLVFPTGLPFKKPDDRTVHQVAHSILADGETRDRLTEGVFSSKNSDIRQGLFDEALKLAEITDPLETTLRRAQRKQQLTGHDLDELAQQAIELSILKPSDLEALQKMQDLRERIIAVDAFDDWGSQLIQPLASSNRDADEETLAMEKD